ncbi:protein of unknown function (plasmid) [Rhodovastum atsumiense]|nr:protein of unknown function [Rhodovastum atsumiense]
MYGVGCLNWVNREGFNIDYRDGAIRYLHPAVMLCNMDVVQQWPMPTKHGAPMVETMVALHDAGRSDLLGHAEWLENDFSNSDNKNYLIHDSRGTVFRVGTYNLDEWQASVMEDRVKAEGYNKELLAMIPKDARGIVEVGCNNGSLACAYKLINPQCIYTGIEINSMAAESARRHCDSVLAMDIEKAEEGFFRECMSRSNVWVFGDVLEHLVDPWSLLGKIRRTLPADGCVVISLPNAQHWSVQGKLSCGFLRYEEHGLLDRTHLRFFTRITMLELLHGAGFRVDQGVTRNFGGINSSNVIAAIKLMAASFGADPEMALADSLPLQYVVRAVPA